MLELGRDYYRGYPTQVSYTASIAQEYQLWLTPQLGGCVTVYEVGTSLAPRGGVMVPPPLDEHLLHLPVS
jgi:hypothetical protein